MLNMVKQFACDDTDLFIETIELQGEGRWFESHRFLDKKGNEYEVWCDQDGDTKVIEC